MKKSRPTIFSTTPPRAHWKISNLILIVLFAVGCASSGDGLELEQEVSGSGDATYPIGGVVGAAEVKLSNASVESFLITQKKKDIVTTLTAQGFSNSSGSWNITVLALATNLITIDGLVDGSPAHLSALVVPEDEHTAVTINAVTTIASVYILKLLDDGLITEPEITSQFIHRTEQDVKQLLATVQVNLADPSSIEALINEMLPETEAEETSTDE